MLREDLGHIVTSAIDCLIRAGDLPESARLPVEIIDTKQPEHGDYATNYALATSKLAGMNPRQLAEKLREKILDVDESGVGDPTAPGRKMVAEGSPIHQDRRPSLIHEIDIAGPGFLNFRLKPEAIAGYVTLVLDSGPIFPKSKIQNPKSSGPKLRINVEFVSVNPNGPITVGSARGAAFGDTLCRVFEATGNEVNREYYINDGVNSEQMRLFAESVRALVRGERLPDNGYLGEYVQGVATCLTQNALRDRHEHIKYTAARGTAAALLEIIFERGIPEAVPTALEGLASDLRRSRRATTQLAFRDPNVHPNPQTFAEYELTQYEEAAQGLLPASKPRQRDLLASFWTVRSMEATRFLAFLHSGELLSESQAYELSIGLAKELENTNAQNEANEIAVVVGNEVSERIDQMMSSAQNTAARILASRPVDLNEWDLDTYRSAAQQQMLECQAEDLRLFGVHFDTWFSEQSLHDAGKVAECVRELEAKGIADTEPYRTVLKLARGGVIEEVKKEPQTEAMEDEEAADEVSPNPPNPQVVDAQSSIVNPPNTQHLTPNTFDSPIVNPSTLWLRSTKFGDDMDRVLRRRDGRLTYIASDVAYHKDKFNRPPNADKLITVLGPDHHGYIHRLQAVLAALLERQESGSSSAASSAESAPGFGEPDSQIFRDAEERDACRAALAQAKEKLDVVIFQVVRFMKDGKPAPMRKRDGNIYELRDLINEVGATVAANATKEDQQRVGADVARFFYLMRSHETSMDFDIDLATKQSDDNPVFYVQYAHARICSVLRKAKEAGIEVLGYWGIGASPSPRTPDSPIVNSSLLTHSRELTLIKKILDFPMEVQRCAEDYGVHRLTTYAIELARTYHHFYDACRVIQTDQPEVSQARLALCEAARLTLKSALDLIGVSTPERMEREERSEAENK